MNKNLISLLNKHLECHLLFDIELFGFGLVVTMDVVAVHYARHFADFSELSVRFETLTKFLVVPSVHIELACPNDRLRVLFENVVGCFAGV